MHTYALTKIILNENEKMIQFNIFKIYNRQNKRHEQIMQVINKHYTHNYHKDNNAVTLGFAMTFFMVFFGLFSSDVEILDCLLDMDSSALFTATFDDWISLSIETVLLDVGVLIGRDTFSVVADRIILFSYVDVTKKKKKKNNQKKN